LGSLFCNIGSRITKKRLEREEQQKKKGRRENETRSTVGKKGRMFSDLKSKIDGGRNRNGGGDEEGAT